MHCDFEPLLCDRSVPYDNNAVLILLVGTTRIKHVFYCITVSNSVDFDQTAHIQK